MARPRDPSRDPRFPDDVCALDRLLSTIRFEPRASLGPELQGRLRREREPSANHQRYLYQILELSVFALVLGLAIFLFWTMLLGTVIGQAVDRCCFELDGGGAAVGATSNDTSARCPPRAASNAALAHR
jgi:hypothetical protein